jgi:hypothetical protein
MKRTAIGLALAAFALSASADASWKCPNMYGTYFYYPTVTQCWNWQWDPNGPAEQAAAAEAQRAAVQRAREEEAAAQAQRAAELARLEVQREAARTQAIAAAKIAAEASPDNICREPKVAGRMLDGFNSMDWPDGRKAVDIEHLVTIANNGDNYLSCHGVWLLKDGRPMEGTLTLKNNVAGEPIAHWRQEGWQPTLPASKPDLLPATKPTAPSVVPAVAVATSSSFNDGASDRMTWEAWFNGLSGEERDGAYYWAAQRSLKNPGDCARLGGAGQVGCAEAKARLSPGDARRKTEPEYKAGWNSINTN